MSVPPLLIFPWQRPPLDKWNIGSMNHYFIKGERMIYVLMCKGHLCIKEEGKDDRYLWNRLLARAEEMEKDPGGTD
jgi:hypothetical protein